MGARTEISWTESTWNPVTGCRKVSPGCDHCYAEALAHRFGGTKAYPNGFDVTLRPERLDQPLRWQLPKKVFVNSVADLFEAAVPDEYIARVWAVMAIAQQHTFQVLTKRPGRMRSLLRSDRFHAQVAAAVGRQWGEGSWHRGSPPAFQDSYRDRLAAWPLPNVWLGVSVENQRWADTRIPVLLGTPAAVRFISAEPLLGPVDLLGLSLDRTRPRLTPGLAGGAGVDAGGTGLAGPLLDWVIVGGESGPKARPMHSDWARSLRDQCVGAGVAFTFKQWGAWRWVREACDQAYAAEHGDLFPGKKWEVLSVGGEIRGDNVPRAGDTVVQRVGKRAAGRELDGRIWDEFPSGPSTVS